MYQRIEDYGTYQRITTVEEISGKYEQYTKWADGTKSTIYCSNIFKMGWKSAREFVRQRWGFKKVSE